MTAAGGGWPRRWLPALAAALAVVLGAAPAVAGSYPAGSVGHDVSYPQCSAPGSSDSRVGQLAGDFGIVGVTGGRPWGPNSCSAAEFSWAAGLPDEPALYLNTANPAPSSSYYWPTSGSRDPALCADAGSTSDAGCAYDYGWHSAQDALKVEAADLSDATALVWWLDVESGNTWNGTGTANAADLQGVVDYLRGQGVPAVGLYSTPADWQMITGGYTRATAAAYASAWAPEFTAKQPMSGSPVWVAGLGDAGSAAAACQSSFTGAATWLAQYDDGSGFDADLACPTPTPAPRHLAAVGGDRRIVLTWSAPADSGAAVTYSVFRGRASGRESSRPLARGLSRPRYVDRRVVNGRRYFYRVTASDAAGTSAPSRQASATPHRSHRHRTPPLEPMRQWGRITGS